MDRTNWAKTSWTNWLSRWVEAEQIRRHEGKVLLLLTLIIGAIVGLVVVAFILVTENLGSRMYPAGDAAWRRVIIPILGALSTGLLLSRYFPDARGSGIPQTKAALFIRGGYISFRTVLGKFGLSSVSLASGIALGREGPSVQVGAGIASVLGRQLGLTQSKVKALVPVGASAALAAAFNTPIAAVLFSLEEVMGDLHAPVLGSIVLSSATSWIVLHLLLGNEPLFHLPAYQLVHPVEFVFYAVLGVVGGLVSVSFVKLLLWLRKHFLRMPKSTQWCQPVAGGLLVGLLGWFVPEVLGVGYGHVSQALNGQIVLGTMALLMVLKVVATATCYASGNAGGIFGPSLFIGAMMGGAVGGIAHLLLPDYTGSIGAYALVGMGAAFAGIVRVPLTSVIMIFEVTRDYSIIVPLMIANLISYFISSRLQEEPIYEALQHQDGIHLPAGAREREGLLVVSRGVRPATEVLSADDRVNHAMATVNREGRAWPVVGRDGLLGMITLAQLEEAMRDGRSQNRLAELLPAPDPRVPLTAENFPHIHADHPLDTAMRRMAEARLDVLPVVSRANLRELVGVISLQDVLAAYGLSKDQSRVEGPSEESKAPAARFGGALAAIAGILVITLLLSHFYRAQRSERIQQYFQAGNELMAKDRYSEAIEQYRNALSISHSREHRLALALALVEAGRLNEAETYLREVLESNPGSGPASLGLARVAVGQGRAQEAVTYYHRAVYGSWPTNPQENRVRVRMELVEALGRSGQKKQAQAELLSWMAEMPNDAAIKKRVGHMLLDFGLPRESADVFRDVLQQDKQDAEAHAGLGEADFARGDYPSARDAFRNALRFNPNDEAARERSELCDQIVAVDPTLRGLRSAERFRRSQRLVEAALHALDQCAASNAGTVLPAPARELADTARKLLLRRRVPRSHGDATESNVSLAEQLWGSRVNLCGSSAGSDEALSRVVARLSR